MPQKNKVLVAMSGGVDSSVTAWLLREQGYDAVGVTMCMGLPDAAEKNHIRCCGPRGVKDARRVCDYLGIPHYVMDFSHHLQTYIIDDFIEEYRNGRTPNPCIRCNKYLKFDILLKKAQALGFPCVATGHYAKILHHGPNSLLMRAPDPVKDQSYFLSTIPRHCLQSILFPLGEYTKNQVRHLAREANLPTATAPESQDICFITNGDYRTLHDSLSDTPGDIVDTAGKVLGRHRGIAHYTVGQRKGLGITGPMPRYVVDIDRKTNRIVVGERRECMFHGLRASRFNLLVDNVPDKALIRIRSAHEPVSSSVTMLENGEAFSARFDTPQEAVTPGQSAVLYGDDGTVFGGGVIDEGLR